MYKLESELTEIKHMLTQINIKKNDKPMADFLDEINENSENSQLNDNSVEFVKS